MGLLEIISLLKNNKNTLYRAIKWLSVACLLGLSTFLGYKNKQLSESLLMAQNNLEVYEGIVEGKENENRALLLDINQLKSSNDSIIQQLVEESKKQNIKTKYIQTAATQTQTIHVNSSKGVRGDIVEILKDTIYSDTVKFNELTTLYYNISKDTVNIDLDISNTQNLYVYNTKEYKNKKNFFKRLITLDFKKVKKTNYKIVDSNDLIHTSNVRVIEITTK